VKAASWVVIGTLCLGFGGAGYAQTGIISTYAGHRMPLDGAFATTQGVVSPQAIASDGAGGIFIGSPQKNQVYHVAADGTIRLVAGIGNSGFIG